MCQSSNIMKSNIHLSVVSPVFQAENIIEELVYQLIRAIGLITEDFEIILINDYSADNSWGKIVEECTKDTRVKGINLSRNFGQHYAITAGLKYAKGEWVVVMDCDLQDHPHEIINLYRKAQEGYDSVLAQRIKRGDPLIKRFLSKIFYSIFSYLTDTKQDPTVANFGIYHCSVIDAVLSMNDQIRFFPTMVQWVGFRKFYLPVQHAGRYEGKTTYGLKELLFLALNIIISFSDKPLRLIAKFGFFIATVSFLTGIIYLILFFSEKILVLGFTTLIISIWFLSGIMILILGILGLYLSKVFEKVKQRPTFIIKKLCNL